MKNAILILASALLALTSCSKDDNGTDPAGETREAYVDATSKTTWQYFSLGENKVVGSGSETETDNRAWAARTDWDLAISRYSIRTNSGAATSVSAQGGVYTFPSQTTFASVVSVPEGATFIADKVVTSEGMEGMVTEVKSDATVIIFKTDDEGNKLMPPVYLQAPVYLFRTADGKHCYKVLFTQYQDEDKVSGHVRFSFAEIQ